MTTNLTKLRKSELIAMINELRAENEVLRDAELRLRSRNQELRAEIEEHCDEIKALRAAKESLCDEVVDLMALNQELAAEPPAPPAPEPEQYAPRLPQPRRQPRDLSGLKAAAMHYKAPSKFDEHGNIVVFVRGAWVLA